MLRTVDRILAISDIHGENIKFLKLLKQVEYDSKQDLLVICGDMIDRGDENLVTIENCMKLQEQGAILLKGNHEQFLEVCLKEMINEDTWRNSPSLGLRIWVEKNGGASMFKEIKDLPKEKLTELLEFVQELPTYFMIGKYIFSHTGGNSNKPPINNTEDEWLWGKENFPYCPAYKDKIAIFGHTPTWLLYPYTSSKRKSKEYRTKAQIWFDKVHNDKIGIDCGGVFGGRLAAIELPSGREFYV